MRKKEKSVRGALLLEDAVHFIIFRELDKMRAFFDIRDLIPYAEATKICDELRAAVQYRRPSSLSKKPRGKAAR